MNWKGRERKAYPPIVWKEPWVKQSCAVCGITTGAAIPKRYAVEVMCFDCPTQPDELANLKGVKSE